VWHNESRRLVLPDLVGRLNDFGGDQREVWKLVGFGTHFVVDLTADSQPRSNWQETFCTLSIFSEQFK
jgi:hypothetical protein